ncbi:MAG TPA: hypothetical protein VGK67_02740 [Myxococcales bacterium]|jgi:cytochrome bd-type quinol oxidase subunit 2
MRKAVYIVGGIAAFFALLASVLIVMLGLVLGEGSSGTWLPVAVMVAIALVHFAGPVVAILLARRSRAGVGLAMALVSLLISLGLVGTLPMMIGAGAQP